MCVCVRKFALNIYIFRYYVRRRSVDETIATIVYDIIMYCYCVAVVLYHSVGQVQSTQTDHYTTAMVYCRYAVRRIGGDDDDD